MKHSKLLAILLLVLLISLFSPIRAHADIAPPEQPPGANILPDSENTQVRMVAETVTLTVLTNPSPNYLGQAATEAVFTMRNLGTETETMEARFPLTFLNGSNGGNEHWPEISDIRVWVKGKQIATHRIQAAHTDPNFGVVEIPWAAFNITFPPNQDVIVTVKYTTNGYGYGPFFDLGYVLETGAGWKDTIGSADIIVKLPYPATAENIGFDPASKAVMVGDEIRWHYEDFEPTPDDNIGIAVLTVSYWQNVLHWRKETQQNPKDGEAWGQLGKAIKPVVIDNKSGFLYLTDETNNKLFNEAIDAYEKAVTLLPKDALWHYGFADLLWMRNNGFAFGFDDEALQIADSYRIANELRQSLALDPKNTDAIKLADWVATTRPWAIRKADDGYDYPILTVTPTLWPTPIDYEFLTATPSPIATSTPQPTLVSTDTAAPISPTKSPNTGSPVCGGAALILIPALVVFWRAKRQRR